jgi:hypothetical protein
MKKSADRRPVIQDASAIHQCTNPQINNTKTKEGEQNMVQVLLHRDWTNTTFQSQTFCLAVHGFHHKISQIKDCQCDLCDSECEQYHIIDCRLRTLRTSHWPLMQKQTSAHCVQFSILYIMFKSLVTRNKEIMIVFCWTSRLDFNLILLWNLNF